MTDPTSEKPIKLSAAKKKVFLEKRLQRKATGEATILIPRRAQHSPAPLTYAQEGVWYAEQLQLDIPTYNMPFAWRLYGPLDMAALERSLNAIIQRHQSLHTHIDLIDDQPMQIIHDMVSLSVQITDLQHLPVAEREATALTWLDAEVHRPFNLRQAPLLRVLLLRLAPADHFLLFNFHHIISDGWSLDLFKQELIRFYAAFIAGETVTLPDLPIQYADFAVWQRQQAEQGAFSADLAYWRQKLANAPPLLELPTDYQRPSRPN